LIYKEEDYGKFTTGCQNWLNEKVLGGYDSIEQAGNDLLEHGCQSGIVSNLIYYTDTCKFYQNHRDEISRLLYEMLESTGLSIPELFGEKWDKEDPLALEQYNQNSLAWFAFEETVRGIIGK